MSADLFPKVDLIIKPSTRQLNIAAALLIKNGLVDEMTGRLTESGAHALEESYLGTPERAALLAEALVC